MRTISEITGDYYEDEDCAFFRNTLQSAFYCFHNARLVDLFVDDKMRFVFVFSKADHEKLKILYDPVRVLNSEAVRILKKMLISEGIPLK